MVEEALIRKDAARPTTGRTVSPLSKLLVFRLDERLYALPLHSVERIIRAVALTPLPNAPDAVLGIINLAGRVVPVFNLRGRFGLLERPIEPGDQLAIVQLTDRTAALIIDGAEAVIDHPAAAITAAASIAPGLKHLTGVVKLDNGLVLIHDVEKFLSADEALLLDAALESELSHAG